MYFPYFRGKQFELMAIRESTEILAQNEFTPIIEPVNENLRGLDRALDELGEAGATAIVVVNPRHGYFSDERDGVLEYVQARLRQTTSIRPGVLLSNEATVESALNLIDNFEVDEPFLIHAGFDEGKALAAALAGRSFKNAFIGDQNRLYRTSIQPISLGDIILRDGFEVRRNADYGRRDHFSDLHVTYELENAIGFGDFLTVGDRYAEGGGPAYAVAIHLTVIDPEKDDDMFVLHFVSDTNHTPVDPASKFAEAVEKLAVEANRGDTLIRRTGAVSEFLDLHHRGHYPGLGYVKKLSMKHHLELMAGFCDEQS